MKGAFHWDMCDGRCSNKDLFIAAAFAQNGSGFNATAMRDVINSYKMNWGEYIEKGRTSWPASPTAKVRQFVTGKQYDTQLMLQLYINDVKILHGNGYGLPLDLTMRNINHIERTYVKDIKYKMPQ